MRAAIEALERSGCEAAGYRLFGAGVEHFCVVRLWGRWRLLLGFGDPTVAVIIDVGEHRGENPARDVYHRLYEALSVDPPSESRDKPPCCDEIGARVVERPGDVGGAEGLRVLVLVLPGGDGGSSGGELPLDLLGGRSGEVGIHPGPNGGQDPVELHRELSQRPAGGLDLGGFGRLVGLGGEHSGHGGLAVAELGERPSHASRPARMRSSRMAVLRGWPVSGVLVASLGEVLPRACISPLWLGPAIVMADCIRIGIRPGGAFVGAFLQVALNSRPVRTAVSASIKGVGRPRLNLGELRSLGLPVPPIEERVRISSR